MWTLQISTGIVHQRHGDSLIQRLRGTTLEGCNNREEVAQFLSDAIRQNLQLRADIPAAHNADTISEIGEPVATGETVITDHVRSIVRECLQEADVRWTSSYQPDINDNHMYDTTGNDDIEQPLEENADNLCIPVVGSEVTAHADSESNKDCEVLDDNTVVNRREREENLLPVKDDCDGIALDDLGSESAQYFPVNSKEIEEMVSYTSSESARYFPVASKGLEEMVSYTEHARINAWKTPEVIKKATEKGVPSKVGGATTRLNFSSAAYPPPQRPSSPTQRKAVPFKQADRWLAGGRDVSCTSAKRMSVPLPGWMERLEERGPKSSPAMRGPSRQTPSSATSWTRLSSPTTGRSLGRSGQFITRGSSPIQYQFQPTRVFMRRIR